MGPVVAVQVPLLCEGVVAVMGLVGPLPRVQQLVAEDVLRPRELLPTHVAGILVVGLWAVRLDVLGQLAQLLELLATLGAGIERERRVAAGGWR